jgi:hypothetical protein
VEGCDFDSCAVGVTVADVSTQGHWEDEDAPAARINSCNFLSNGDGITARNIVFENITAQYVINVSQNYWEVAPELSILNQSQDGGMAPKFDGFVDWPDTLLREWRD